MDEHEARQSLELIDQAMDQTRRAIARGGSGYFFIIWGIVWLFGFLGNELLAPTTAGKGAGSKVSMTAPPESAARQLQAGDVGEAITRLRPAGKARFGDAIVDVVATGEFLDAGTPVEIIEIHGGRVVVRKIESSGKA